MSSVRYWTLLACGVLLLAATRSPAQQVPADFKADLVYEVPDIEHPSAVTCDDEGNLFVGEDPMDMRGPSTGPIDRIVLIRWNKNGGSPVKTVFCENLSAVFGMVWHQGALYVMNAPYYTMLKDTDGDGIADVRKRLTDSFGHAPGLFGLIIVPTVISICRRSVSLAAAPPAAEPAIEKRPGRPSTRAAPSSVNGVKARSSIIS